MGFFPGERMADVATRMDVVTLDNFIGGRSVQSAATSYYDVRNPAVGSEAAYGFL